MTTEDVRQRLDMINEAVRKLREAQLMLRQIAGWRAAEDEVGELWVKLSNKWIEEALDSRVRNVERPSGSPKDGADRETAE